MLRTARTSAGSLCEQELAVAQQSHGYHGCVQATVPRRHRQLLGSNTGRSTVMAMERTYRRSVKASASRHTHGDGSDAGDGGGRGRGGGSGGGGGGNSSGGGNEEDNFSGSNCYPLHSSISLGGFGAGIASAATSSVDDSSVPDTADPSELASNKQTELASIKRLLREVFKDLLTIKGNIEKLKDKNASSSSWSGPGMGTTYTGNVSWGGAYVLLNEEADPTVTTKLLNAALLKIGSAVKVKVEGTHRDGADTFLIEASSTKPTIGTEIALSIRRIVYKMGFGDSRQILFKFIPLGGQGSDVGPPLNPLGQHGLTVAAAGGSPISRECLGSGGTASTMFNEGLLEFGAGAFFKDWESNPENITSSGILQTTFRPGFRTAVSACAMYCQKPQSEHDPNSWLQRSADYMTPTRMTTMSNLYDQRKTPSSTINPTMPSMGAPSRRMCIGAHGAMVVSDSATIAGWANIDVKPTLDSKQVDYIPGTMQWGVMASPAPNGQGRWGFLVSKSLGGGSITDDLSNGAKPSVPVFHYEGFVRLTDRNARVGLLPGVVHMRSGSQGATAVMLRAYSSF